MIDAVVNSFEVSFPCILVQRLGNRKVQIHTIYICTRGHSLVINQFHSPRYIHGLNGHRIIGPAKYNQLRNIDIGYVIDRSVSAQTWRAGTWKDPDMSCKAGMSNFVACIFRCICCKICDLKTCACYKRFFLLCACIYIYIYIFKEGFFLPSGHRTWIGSSSISVYIYIKRKKQKKKTPQYHPF